MRIVLAHAQTTDGCRLVFERELAEPERSLPELDQFRVVAEDVQHVVLESPSPLSVDVSSLIARFKDWRLLSNM